MQMNTLQSNTSNTKSRQVGRGGTRGKTAGRGTKGQNARAGRKKRPEMRDRIKKIPKLRGRGKNSNKTIQSKAYPLNLSRVEEVFSAGDTVSPQTLQKKGVITSVSGSLPAVKILGGGTLTKKISVVGCQVSGAARKHIEDLGGSVA